MSKFVQRQPVEDGLVLPKAQEVPELALFVVPAGCAECTLCLNRYEVQGLAVTTATPQL